MTDGRRDEITTQGCSQRLTLHVRLINNAARLC